MHRVRITHSITEIDRASWDACFTDATETYDYLLAVEQAGISGFAWRYVAVEFAGRIIAAVPAFLTDYALDTTLTGRSRDIVAGIRRLIPHALTLRLACLGSPCTETISLGFAPSVPDADKPRLLRMMLTAYDQHAASEHCGLVAAKDVAADTRELWETAMSGLGFQALPGLPVAHLTIDFASADEYLARLSTGTRKDMRRKLRSLASVRVELTDDLGAGLNTVLDLYRETRARAEMQFEELTPAYFTNVLSGMSGRAFCALYYAEDRLLAANLLLQDEDTLLDKFFCMDGDAGREHNLYFLSWFTNIRLCIERGLSRYQSGQAAYANKVRLGSQLTQTAMYFRHRNPIVSAGLRLAAPLFVSDPAFGASA